MLTSLPVSMGSSNPVSFATACSPGLLRKDGADGSDLDPALTFLGAGDGVASVRLDDFAAGNSIRREVPVRRIRCAEPPYVR